LALLGYTDVNPAHASELAKHFPNASRIALTFGADGAYLQVDGASAQAPVPIVDVTDTVGAGDTFWGNTLADWANINGDAAARVTQTLKWAMQAAAINCTRAGCQPPSKAEVQRALG
jgi:fructokinase